MSEQHFSGAVEQVAAGDIKNFVEAPKTEKEYLSSAQRQALNGLVSEVSTETEIDARIIWREVVHARVGVERIGDIPKEQFLEAQDALVCYRDNHRRQANIKLLVSRITNETKAKSIYSERDAYCLRQFGEKQLNAMSTDQLRQVLVFVEDYQAVVQPEPTPAESVPVPGFAPRMLELLQNNPLHMMTAVLAGFIVGKVL